MEEVMFMDLSYREKNPLGHKKNKNRLEGFQT